LIRLINLDVFCIHNAWLCSCSSISNMPSVDFHRDGSLLVAVDSQGAILQVDVLGGKVLKRFRCTNHPFGLCRYTHHDQAVLLCATSASAAAASAGGVALPSSCSSSPNCDIHYLSLYDNSYLRHFKGHSGEVTSLVMSPCSDDFASASIDRSVLLWNLKTQAPVARLPLPPAPTTATTTSSSVSNNNETKNEPLSSSSESVQVAYDPTGKVLAAAYAIDNPNTTSSSGGGDRGSLKVIKLFDAKNYSTGPFDTFTLDFATLRAFLVSQRQEQEKERQGAGGAGNGAGEDNAGGGEDDVGAWADAFASKSEWCGLNFSPGDGDFLLVSTSTAMLLLLDAFNGKLVRAYFPPPSSASSLSSLASSSSSSSSSPSSSSSLSSSSSSEGVNGDAASGVGSGSSGGVADENFCGTAAAFTPDGKQVVAGTAAGEVVFWAVPEPPKDDEDDDDNSVGGDGESAAVASVAANAINMFGLSSSVIQPVKRLKGKHASRVNCVACSPVLECMVSGCSALALWTAPDAAILAATAAAGADAAAATSGEGGVGGVVVAGGSDSAAAPPPPPAEGGGDGQPSLAMSDE
jgi:WD40 repeat protein